MEELNSLKTLVSSLIILKGIASKGRNKGKPYRLVTVDKSAMFNKATVALAEQCGVEVIDTTSGNDDE